MHRVPKHLIYLVGLITVIPLLFDIASTETTPREAARRIRANFNRTSISEATKRKLDEVFALLRNKDWSHLLLRRLKDEKTKRETTAIEAVNDSKQVVEVSAPRDVRSTSLVETVVALDEVVSSGENPDQPILLRRHRRSALNLEPDLVKATTQSSAVSTSDQTLTDSPPILHESTETIDVTDDDAAMQELILQLAAASWSNQESMSHARLAPEIDESNSSRMETAPDSRPIGGNTSETNFEIQATVGNSTPAISVDIAEGQVDDAGQLNMLSSGDEPKFTTSSVVTSSNDPEQDVYLELGAGQSVLEYPEPAPMEFPLCPADVDYYCEHGECIDLGFEIYSCNCSPGYTGVSCEHMDLKAVLVEIRYIGGVRDPAAAAHQYPAAYSSAVVVAQYLSGEIVMFR